jgi:hypothetical protein
MLYSCAITQAFESEDEMKRSYEPANTGSKQAETRFKPGQSGNPAGRPKGAKSQFTEDFWRDLRDVWKLHGRAAIERVIAEDPAKFLAIAASKVPGEIEVSNTSYVIVAPEAAASTEEWLESLSVRRPDQALQ